MKHITLICLLASVFALWDRAYGEEDAWMLTAKPLLERYCIDCHNADLNEGELDLDRFSSASSVMEDEEVWRKVVERLKIAAMPPEDAQQPSDEERHKLLSIIDETLFGQPCDLEPKPGKVTLRRLNRSEYNNTIRDLFRIDMKPADAFPSDEVGAGFDNNGDVLALPPMLLEKYVAAAESVATAAITDPKTLEKIELSWMSDKVKIDGDAKPNRFNVYDVKEGGRVLAEFAVPYEARYGLHIRAASKDKSRKLTLVTMIDDEQLGESKFAFNDDPGGSDHEWVGLDLKAGKHRIVIQQSEGERLPVFKFRGFEIDGPHGVPNSEVSPVHWDLVRHRPQRKKRSVKQAATENLKPFLRRAFRGPVDSQTIDDFARLAEIATNRDETFERGMQVAVTAALVSPRFLFRSELPPSDAESGNSIALNDHQLASRLSYFIWSSMPDDRLLELADRGKLTGDIDTLRKEVSRMIYERRGDAMADNFASQWLGLRNLAELAPDPKQYPDFDEDLRRDMLAETRRVFIECMRGGGSVLDLINADSSFLNERLAQHYGIKDVRGSELRRVSLKGTGRAGILTHASVLMLTSNPTRTSPVKRGKWVMESILGTPPPEPPPGVPELEETAGSNPDAPLREQLAIHRQDAMCASCHRQMDAIGFSFENFDVIGQFRDRDGPHAIDASGELPTGESFVGAEQLAKILRETRGEMFVSELTRRLMTFALGRELERADQCMVDEIVAATKNKNWRFIDIVSAIVESRAFRFQTVE